jgi:hypothetical protein
MRAFNILILLTAMAVGQIAFGQQPKSPNTVIQPNLEQQLSQLLESADRKQHALDALGERRSKMPSGAASVEIDNEIETTQKQLNDLREQFLQLATDNFSFNLSPANPTPQVDINWQQDMIQIIHPLLLEMKDLTERPRAIERLNGEINYYREQSQNLDNGLIHLQQLEAAVKDERLSHALKILANKVKDRRDDIEQKLNTLERQLADQRKRPSELSKTVAEGIRSFAINIGLYLLLAAAASLAIFLAVRLIGKLICKMILDRYNEQLIVVERGVHFLTQLLSVLLAALAFLVVLYAVNAWVLFALSLIVLLGLLLSLRNMVPTYVMEVRTLLNLGSLRQNERLMLNGLPWRVVTLDMYTLLHNPALDGFLRVPLMQISRLSSRPFHSDEPWFPSAVGDFVLMLDGLLGRVELQTPEMVQLNIDNSIVTYRTEQFLNQRPQNLSQRGFGVGTNFSIDYSHRHEATTTIVDTLRYELKGAIAQADFGKHCTAMNVELKAASTSSIDFRISALFNGEAAEMYSRIQRWLQKFSIDCANKHDWEIPFPQMTVHYRNDEKNDFCKKDESREEK